MNSQNQILDPSGFLLAEGDRGDQVDPAGLGNPAAAEIDSVPGVVDHGLFLSEAEELLTEKKQGAVRRLIRG